MKKLLVIGLMVLSIFVVTGCGCGNKDKDKTDVKKETKESINTNKGIIKEQTVDGIKFKNAILLMDGEGMSSFKITVVNESGKPRQVETFKVTLKGKEGNVLLETYGYVGYELKNGESTDVMISLDQDMKEATEVQYELIK